MSPDQFLNQLREARADCLRKIDQLAAVVEAVDALLPSEEDARLREGSGRALASRFARWCNGAVFVGEKGFLRAGINGIVDDLAGAPVVVVESDDPSTQDATPVEDDGSKRYRQARSVEEAAEAGVGFTVKRSSVDGAGARNIEEVDLHYVTLSAPEAAVTEPAPDLSHLAVATVRDKRIQNLGVGKGGGQELRIRPLAATAPPPPLDVTKFEFPDNAGAAKVAKALIARGYKRRSPGAGDGKWRQGQFDCVRIGLVFVVRVFERYGEEPLLLGENL